jgi:hypothetical protein
LLAFNLEATVSKKPKATIGNNDPVRIAARPTTSQPDAHEDACQQRLAKYKTLNDEDRQHVNAVLDRLYKDYVEVPHARG